MDIALIGKAGSGKDTAAAYLCSAHGYTRLAFADPLKEMALRIDPIVSWDYDDNAVRLSEELGAAGRLYPADNPWDRAKETPEVRRILQVLGQAQREVDPLYWVRLLMDKWDIVDPRIPTVVADARYPNEARMLVDNGFALVRITRSGAGLSGEAATHDSETALDDWPVNYTTENNGSIADLHAELDKIIRA